MEWFLVFWGSLEVGLLPGEVIARGSVIWDERR